MASDLRDHGRDCSLSECLRVQRAALQEGARSESACSDAVRGTLQGRTACRSGDFRRACQFRGDQVPKRAAPYGLIGRVTGSLRPKHAPGAGTGAPPDITVAQVVRKDVPIYGEWICTLDGFAHAD